MITIQRVRVRWTPASRGAPAANVRRGLCAPVPLPSGLPAGEVAIHDVLIDEAAGYVPRARLTGGDLSAGRGAGLELSARGSALAVARVGRAAYPPARGPGRVFTLTPGEVGRYRANFRFTTTVCTCDMSWYYEEWLILVGHGSLDPAPVFDVDHRVSLYGGTRGHHRGRPRQ